jgi:hypothetical protein
MEKWWWCDRGGGRAATTTNNNQPLPPTTVPPTTTTTPAPPCDFTHKLAATESIKGPLAFSGAMNFQSAELSAERRSRRIKRPEVQNGRLRWP